jgi:hypothetical protein
MWLSSRIQATSCSEILFRKCGERCLFYLKSVSEVILDESGSIFEQKFKNRATNENVWANLVPWFFDFLCKAKIIYKNSPLKIYFLNDILKCVKNNSLCSTVLYISHIVYKDERGAARRCPSRMVSCSRGTRLGPPSPFPPKSKFPVPTPICCAFPRSQAANKI